LATLLSEQSWFINKLALCYYPVRAQILTLFADVSSNEVIYIHRLDGCGVGIKWRSTGEDSNIPLAFPHIRARSRRLVIYMIINLSRSTYYRSWRSCGLV